MLMVSKKTDNVATRNSATQNACCDASKLCFLTKCLQNLPCCSMYVCVGILHLHACPMCGCFCEPVLAHRNYMIYHAPKDPSVYMFYASAFSFICPIYN